MICWEGHDYRSLSLRFRDLGLECTARNLLVHGPAHPEWNVSRVELCAVLWGQEIVVRDLQSLTCAPYLMLWGGSQSGLELLDGGQASESTPWTFCGFFTRRVSCISFDWRSLLSHNAFLNKKGKGPRCLSWRFLSGPPLVATAEIWNGSSIDSSAPLHSLTLFPVFLSVTCRSTKPWRLHPAVEEAH